MPANRYNLTLEFAELPSDADGYRRLRSALKRLLRNHGARCLDCRRCIDAERTDKDPEKQAIFEQRPELAR